MAGSDDVRRPRIDPGTPRPAVPRALAAALVVCAALATPAAAQRIVDPCQGYSAADLRSPATFQSLAQCRAKCMPPGRPSPSEAELQACIGGGPVAGGEPGGGPAGAVTSTFRGGPEGWRTGNLPDGGPYDTLRGMTTPKWDGAGGQRGGAISMTDPEGYSDFCFDAPSPYLGDKRAFYGGELRYQLRCEGGSGSLDEPDVILVGGGLILVYDRPGSPGSGWGTYAVPLSEAGWTVGRPRGTPATSAEFTRVLGSLTALRINGEFRSGADTGSLANVSIVQARNR
jgi:hypothetical protein